MRYLREWRRRRWLKALGVLSVGEVKEALRYRERAQLDAMPAQWGRPRSVSFCADRWIVGWREMPRVRSRLGGGK